MFAVCRRSFTSMIFDIDSVAAVECCSMLFSRSFRMSLQQSALWSGFTPTSLINDSVHMARTAVGRLRLGSSCICRHPMNRVDTPATLLVGKLLFLNSTRHKRKHSSSDVTWLNKVGVPCQPIRVGS